MSQSQETYTFSLALHMMRYSGKKMKTKFYSDGYYIFVKGNEIHDSHGYIIEMLDVEDLMGEWVEVK